MRPIILAIAILLTVAPGATGHSFSDEQILYGFPANYAPTVFPCDPTSIWQGVNGYWYDVTSYPSHFFLITMGDPLDPDPYFYDSNCIFISNGGAPMGGISVTEHGTIPPNAAWMLVWAKAGVGTYSMHIMD